MICSSTKLSYQCLGPYIVKKQVESMAYCLKLPSIMKRLHLMFNAIKLTAVLEDSISCCYSKTLSNSTLIDRQEKWEVKKILNNHWH